MSRQPIGPPSDPDKYDRSRSQTKSDIARQIKPDPPPPPPKGNVKMQFIPAKVECPICCWKTRNEMDLIGSPPSQRIYWCPECGLVAVLTWEMGRWLAEWKLSNDVPFDVLTNPLPNYIPI